MTRSGGGASALPKCQFFKEMRFLHEKTANLPTESNFISGPSQAPENCENSPETVLHIPAKRKPVHHTPVSSRHKVENRQEAVDGQILKELASTDDVLTKIMSEEKENEVHLYCQSLIPIISALPVRKQRLAFIKISQLLIDLEFEKE